MLNAQDLDNNLDDFQRLFRVSRGTFEVILRNIGPLLPRRHPKSGRPQIQIERDLLMTLWYLGNQETIRSISDMFNVQESTFITHNRRMLDIFCG